MTKVKGDEIRVVIKRYGLNMTVGETKALKMLLDSLLADILFDGEGSVYCG